MGLTRNVQSHTDISLRASEPAQPSTDPSDLDGIHRQRDLDALARPAPLEKAHEVLGTSNEVDVENESHRSEPGGDGGVLMRRGDGWVERVKRWREGEGDRWR